MAKIFLGFMEKIVATNYGIEIGFKIFLAGGIQLSLIYRERRVVTVKHERPVAYLLVWDEI